MVVVGDVDFLKYETKKAIFGSDEIVSIAIPLGDVLNPDSISFLIEASDAIAALPGVADVDSLATVYDVVQVGNDLEIAPVLPRDLSGGTPSAEYAVLGERIRSHPIWPGFLVSDDLSVASIDIRFRDHLDQFAKEELLRSIDALLAHLLDGETFHFAGHPFMKSEIARTIVADLLSLTPVTFLVIAVLFLVATRSLTMTLIVLACVSLSVVLTVSAMGWLGLPLTALSNTAPCVLLALGTAYLMHICAAVQSTHRSVPERGILDAVGQTREPTMLAAATTAAGYASLTLSEVPIIRTYGLSLALGMLAILVVALTALPSLLALFPARSRGTGFSENTTLARLLGSVAGLSYRRATVIVGGAIALGAASLYSLSYLEVDASGLERFRKNSRYRQSADFYRENLSGDMIENVYLSGDEGAFLNPEVLDGVKKLQRSLEELPEISKTLSVVDYIGRVTSAFEREGTDSIPRSSSGVAQYLLLLSSAGDGSELNELISPDHSELRIVIKASVPSSSASAALRDRIRDLANQQIDDASVDIDVLSTEILLSEAADTIAVEQTRSFVVALVVVLALVSLGFRSLCLSLELLLPNALPIALYLGTLSALGFSLSDATSIIAAAALGMAVDGSVHLASARRRAIRTGWDRNAAMVYAVMTAGKPVVISTLLIASGFSCLLLSEFRTIAALGGFTALTIVYCMLSDLLFLPAQSWVLGARTRGSDVVLVGRNGDIFPGRVLRTGQVELFRPGAERPEVVRSRDVWTVRSLSIPRGVNH